MGMSKAAKIVSHPNLVAQNFRDYWVDSQYLHMSSLSKVKKLCVIVQILNK
jgi:hypothetical protein